MKILINRTDAIGDTVLTLPMAQMIKKHHPDAEIHFIISQKSSALFDGIKTIDHVHIYPHHLNFFKRLSFVRTLLKNERYTHYFFVGGKHLLSMGALASRIPFRGGLISRLASYFYLNRGVRQKRSFVEMHELEYNLKLLAPMNLIYKREMLEECLPKLIVQDNETSEASTHLKTLAESEGKKWTGEFIIIHPGMMGHTLNWSMKNYVRLVSYLEEIFKERFLFVFSYTPGDKKYIEEVQDAIQSLQVHCTERVLFYDGSKKGLRNYMATVKGAAAFIGPSTGTTHIAAALRTPTVGIYSPIKVQSALRWGPIYRGTTAEVVSPEVVCGEPKQCQGEECPYYFCMSKIEVAEVGQLVVQLIERS